jgi:HNH endonuclease
VIRAEKRAFVRRRARNRCEYCLLDQAHCEFTHQIEHIIARQHGGSDNLENLALACIQCNRFKGPNLTGIDPRSGAIVRLFHPRLDRWHGNFSFEGPPVEGITAVERTTVQVLEMKWLWSPGRAGSAAGGRRITLNARAATRSRLGYARKAPASHSPLSYVPARCRTPVRPQTRDTTPAGSVSPAALPSDR